MESPLVRSSSRLEAYSDAIFSIVATVMIVPISHTEIPADEELGKSFAKVILPQLGVYIVTFLIICSTWGRHVWIFETIAKVDELIALLNLALMMTITFFPYTFTLLGNYPTNHFAIMLFSGIVILVGLLQFLFILHVFRNPHLLSDDVRENLGSLKAQRNGMFASVFTPVILASCAGIAATFSSVLAGILLIMIMFGNFLRRNAIKLYRKVIECCRAPPDFEISIEEEATVSQKLLTVIIPKERAECFSDGVFAIVATLIILDICEENVPKREDYHKAGDSLVRALSHDESVFLAYAGTFVSTGLLWYVHHSLLHYIKEFNMLMGVFNNLCLLSIGFTPLVFKMVSIYDEPGHRIYSNETVAIQLNCITIFLAGIFQCFVWVAALWSPRKSLIPSGNYGTAEHNYLTAKLCVFPLVSVLVYLLSLGSNYQLKSEAFNGMQIGCLGLFLLLQVIYTVYKKKQRVIHNPGIEVEPVVDNECV